MDNYYVIKSVEEELNQDEFIDIWVGFRIEEQEGGYKLREAYLFILDKSFEMKKYTINEDCINDKCIVNLSKVLLDNDINISAKEENLDIAFETFSFYLGIMRENDNGPQVVYSMREEFYGLSENKELEVDFGRTLNDLLMPVNRELIYIIEEMYTFVESLVRIVPNNPSNRSLFQKIKGSPDYADTGIEVYEIGIHEMANMDMEELGNIYAEYLNKLDVESLKNYVTKLVQECNLSVDVIVGDRLDTNWIRSIHFDKDTFDYGLGILRDIKSGEAKLEMLQANDGIVSEVKQYKWRNVDDIWKLY